LVKLRNTIGLKDESDMSEEESFWFSMSEKLIGILVAIIGGLFLYFTFISSNALGAFTGLFGFLGLIILLLGLFMLIIKPKE
jgi:hypothetical protein